MVIFFGFCDIVTIYFINQVQLLSFFLLPPFPSSFYRLIVGKSNWTGASFSYYQNRTIMIITRQIEGYSQEHNKATP